MKRRPFRILYTITDTRPMTSRHRRAVVLVVASFMLFRAATVSAQSFPIATPPVPTDVDSTIVEGPSLTADEPMPLRTAASPRPLYTASQEGPLDMEMPVEELPDDAMTLTDDDMYLPDDEESYFEGDCDSCGGQGCCDCDYCEPVFRRSCTIATAPEMFGGTFPIGLQVFGTYVDGNGTNQFSGDLPLAAHSRRTNISTNNRALPSDRAYFLYQDVNNAQNAFLNPATLGPAETDLSIERYTFGLEKAFFEQSMSVELRMPISNGTDYYIPAFGTLGGDVGNLAVITKFSLAESDWYSVVGGVGVDTPTGSDVVGRVGNTWFTVRNESVHILPYIGMLIAPSQRCFHQWFVQGDIPTNGNEVAYGHMYDGSYASPMNGYSFDDQTLLHVDWQSGYWLYQNSSRTYPCGLAAMVELHYTTTLQDSDRIVGVAPPMLPPPMMIQPAELEFSVPGNRLDVLNLTGGLHALAGPLAFRVAAVVPLTDDFNRLFDAELQGSVNVWF